MKKLKLYEIDDWTIDNCALVWETITQVEEGRWESPHVEWWLDREEVFIVMKKLADEFINNLS